MLLITVRLVLSVVLLVVVWRQASWGVALSLTLLMIFCEMAAAALVRLQGDSALIKHHVARLLEIMAARDKEARGE